MKWFLRTKRMIIVKSNWFEWLDDFCWFVFSIYSLWMIWIVFFLHHQPSIEVNCFPFLPRQLSSCFNFRQVALRKCILLWSNMLYTPGPRTTGTWKRPNGKGTSSALNHQMLDSILILVFLVWSPFLNSSLSPSTQCQTSWQIDLSMYDLSMVYMHSIIYIPMTNFGTFFLPTPEW